MTEDEKGLVSDFLTIDYSKIADSYDPQIVDPVKGTKLKDEAFLVTLSSCGSKKLWNTRLGISNHGLALLRVGLDSKTMMALLTIW